MLHALVAAQTAVLTLFTRRCAAPWRRRSTRARRRTRLAGDGGQATAEYALVLLGVAAVALLLLAWATRSGKLGELFDALVDNLIGKAR